MTLEILPSVCAIDCPDACSLHITVEDGRVTKLSGNPEHPITKGFACVKMSRYPERQEQADRLLYPQRRIGKKGEGKFERISWDEALEEIAQRTQKILYTHGGQSILPYHYGGTMGQLESNRPVAFFRQIGALELDQTICATTGGAGWEANYGPYKMSTDPEDLIHSRYVILWGINALRSNSHIAPILKEARKRGARILHIDPYRNETSRFADEHWQIRVGTDAALALAFANEILNNGWQDQSYLDDYATGLDDFKEACSQWSLERAAEYCDIPLNDLQRVVRDFAMSESPYIKVGYGMTRNESGGNAMRAISLLPALLGAWKKPGGGAGLSTSGAFKLNSSAISGLALKHSGARLVNMNLLASELTPETSTIHGLFVFNSNPAAVAPDSSRVREGLSREDLFCVVLEHFQTDTADYADYLLPATTFLEHPDVYTSYGHYYLQYAAPVTKARGEAKPNSWFFRELARRIGLEGSPLEWDTEQAMRELLNSNNPWLAGVDLESLKRHGSVRLKFPAGYRPYAKGSHFPDGKIRFSPAPQQLEFAEVLTKEFPLRLISPPGSHIVNTTMGNVPSIIKAAGGEPSVVIHPDDAISRKIVDGEYVSVKSNTGEIKRRVRVSDEAKQGVVVALGQWWPKLAPDKKSLNDITNERLTDLGGGSTFGNVAVQVARLGT
ncbi:MAG: molybdopterin-dependent oxidoreductase [Pirellula sp.]|jgi:anaerobic selenocysteine-containing dehydrogenase